MTRKTHDADLCERIRELEKRVEELEAQPRVTYVPTFTHYCWSGCPEHYPTITWQTGTWPFASPPPTITYAKGVSTDSSTYVVGDIT